MTIVITSLGWFGGICLGFIWGCECGLDKPDRARGLVKYFRTPWRVLLAKKNPSD